jgi:hypothetical protein
MLIDCCNNRIADRHFLNNDKICTREMKITNSGIPQKAVETAGLQFGRGTPAVKLLGNGLINRTYLVDFTSGPSLVLQCINQVTFPAPGNIINNYRLIQDYLGETAPGSVPALLKASDGNYHWVDDNKDFWRATAFINGSYALPLPGSAKEVFAAAKAFAHFTQSLEGLQASKLAVIIPHFHNLSFRYRQFEEAVKTAPVSRLLKATHVISEIRNHTALVEFYEAVEKDEQGFPTRIMHHDCKISNILFDRASGDVICPVDLDTVMPGKYFSDIGDMVRTMACTEEENSVTWESIDVNADYYNSIINGYREGMGNSLTQAELANIHQPGLLLTYMQCIRFVTDFLNGDVYYKTVYPEQNLNRALNQLILLEKLEAFIAANY